MKHQLTTIAALPSGSGSASALRPEVGEAPPQDHDDDLGVLFWAMLADQQAGLAGERQGFEPFGYTERS